MPPLILLIGMANNAYTENLASEKRWAEQLRDNIVIGEPADLPIPGSANGESHFFAIFTPHSTAKPKGAIILMHGTGAHPDWSDIIHPLRIQLPDKGWATLSIQLPLTFPENDREQDKKNTESKKQVIESSVPRINSAINFLQEKSYKPIVLVSHSFGSLMALNFLQLNTGATPAATPGGKPPISGAVLIGTPSSGRSIPLNSPAMLEKVQIPLLDLYGSEDLSNVLRSAKDRKTAAYKAGNQQYRQVKTIGANHFYTGLEDELLTYVSGWLKKNIAQGQ